MRRILFLMAVCAAVVDLAGCASLTTGPNQRIAVNSNPQGADVETDSGFTGVTPCNFKMQRNRDHIMKISKDGYKTAKVVFTRTLCGSTAGNLIVGGIIGVGVDAMTGAMYKLCPENVSVDLVPGDRNEIITVNELEKKNKQKSAKDREKRSGG
ncbi:MAG: PEGA domain-containing protein [Candidatus Omnitrophota bacterium]